MKPLLSHRLLDERPHHSSLIGAANPQLVGSGISAEAQPMVDGSAPTVWDIASSRISAGYTAHLNREVEYSTIPRSLVGNMSHRQSPGHSLSHRFLSGPQLLPSGSPHSLNERNPVGPHTDCPVV